MTDVALSRALRGGTGAGDVSALWLATQHVIAGRVAHELRNTLNGVAVNLEVVRSRLARAAAAAAAGSTTAGPASGTFAETASAEFERLTSQVEALLALVRPVRAPADLALVANQLAALLGLAAQREGGGLVVEGTDGAAARTSIDAEAARLVVAHAMLAALHEGVAHEVRCTLTAAAGQGSRLTITRAGQGPALVLPDDVARVAGDAGVHMDAPHTGDSTALILTFPPVHGADD